MLSTIGPQLSFYFHSKGITQVDIASQLGVSKAYVNSLFTGRRPFGKKQAEIWESLYGISRSWLLTGKGEMLLEDKEERGFTPDFKESKVVMVPLIHIDSVGGMDSENLLTSGEQYVERMIPFANARENDRAILQSGTSMVPTILPGSILHIRKVHNWQEYFGYGGDFVLWLTDDRRITKQVLKYAPDPRHYITCHSYNPEVEDEELPKSMIREVWKVVNVLISKGW